MKTHQGEELDLKLANYAKDGSPPAVGMVEDDYLLPLGYATIDDLLARGATRREFFKPQTNGKFPISSVRLLTPVLRPQKILMLAINYFAHGKEQQETPPAEPYLFCKFQNSLVNPNEPILVPLVSKKVDWEVELAVVIGKEGKYIKKEDAYSHVAGYSVAVDVSFRDLQFPKHKSSLGMNWVKGKALDFSFPLGPWLVTSDEVSDPHSLRISLKVNGETRQDSSTSDMVFKIDSLIEYISQGMTLKAGDIISTGTPQGVAAFSGKPYLQDGDIVEAAIEGIGTLRNPVRAEHFP